MAFLNLFWTTGEWWLTLCGIVGYIGKEQAAPILLDGLQKLEYRGYDSAGIAVYHDTEIQVEKSEGRLKNLFHRVAGGEKLLGTLGIGHTRWATHGKPSFLNAHPQISQHGMFVVVHNGIIENYLSLKEDLLKQGKEFTSETDTEVIAQLLEQEYQGDILQAISQTIQQLEGSYALGILCKDAPNILFAARKDSPLIIGLGKNENFIASDVPAILEHTREIYRMDNQEIAVIHEDSVQIYDKHLQPVKKDALHIDWDISVAEKEGYDHFMLKEIMEQPKAIADTVSPRIQDGKIVLDDIVLTKEQLEQYRKIMIVACGSAYHVGVVAKYVIEKMTRISVEVDIASEFRYRHPIVDSSTLVIAISQSGETADTLAAVREAKQLGARVISIVNVVGSSIAAESDDVLYTLAGPEISVATTKAYSTQLILIYLLSIYIGDKLGKISPAEYTQYLQDLERLPKQIEEILQHKSHIQQIADKYFETDNIFFIGRNLDYAMSLEGSLKLKEISYIHSEAYAAGELKHGTISLVENGTLVIALATQEFLYEKVLSNVKEVKARGALVLGLTTKEHTDIEKSVDDIFYIPKTNAVMLPSLAVVPLQLFAYYVASKKGCDIDKPRNLAKSVTVE